MNKKTALKVFILILIPLFVLMSFSSSTGMSGQFKRKLKVNSIAFYRPNGFVVSPSFQHADLPNEFTLSKSLDEFEIRYSIHPLKQELKVYKKNLKNPTLKLIHPNLIWKTTLQERIKKLSANKLDPPVLRDFSEEAFSDQFKGDAGGICFFEIAENAQLGYAYAITMVVHRNFVADLYVTFLGNDEEKLQDLSLEAFHAMVFTK